MEKKRSRITYLMIGGTLVLAAWAASAMPRLRSTPKTLTTQDPPIEIKKDPPQVVQVPKAKPRIEVVFALDTTGSMSGLIDGAKRKIWSIANFIAQGNPKPELRIGLVAYRDVTDEYVTRFYDLSDDLDKVFEHLNSFEAAGGGDTPEHVSKALYDAVERASWSKDQGVLKQIYLVGDAPPHTDYADGYDYRKLAKKAHDEGIHINTIRCGMDRQTQLVWNEISNVSAGEYASIDQSGGVIAVATPYDAQLQALNAKLLGTAIGYGSHRSEVRAKVAAAAAAPAPVAADRLGYLGTSGGGAAVSGDGDLVKDWAEGKASPAKLAEAELPAELAGLPGAKREEVVKEKKAERDKITAEINALSLKRNVYLKGKNKADAFDARVESAIKAQAKSIGVAY